VTRNCFILTIRFYDDMGIPLFGRMRKALGENLMRAIVPGKKGRVAHEWPV